MRALISSDSKINIIHPIYTTKLGFCFKKIVISIQKIDKSYFNIFEIVIANFLVKNRIKKV